MTLGVVADGTWCRGWEKAWGERGRRSVNAVFQTLCGTYRDRPRRGSLRSTVAFADVAVALSRRLFASICVPPPMDPSSLPSTSLTYRFPKTVEISWGRMRTDAV
jgi:hypothetical protein